MRYKLVILGALLVAAMTGLSIYALIHALDAQDRALKAENRAQRAEGISKLLRLATIVNHNLSTEYPELKDQFQKAIHLRNLIYQSIPLKPTPQGFDFLDCDLAYLSSMRDDSVGHQCGGIAAIYLTALESQGIPARFVGIVSSDKHPYESHNTVEFWYQGKWYASDPTFNVMFQVQGAYLSYSQLFDHVRQGLPYDVVTNEFHTKPGRTFAEYRIKLPELMKYMVVHPAKIWFQGKYHEYSMELYPRTWNGTVTNQQGQNISIINFVGIYETMNKGPVR